VPPDRIPILILADCEPDPRLVSRDSPDRWTGFEQFFDYLSSRRAAFGARTGVPARFGWFWRVDLQVEVVYGAAEWPLRTYARQIADSEAHLDEHGLHTHAWQWDEGLSEWVADHGTQPVVEACVRQAFAAFERVFGRGCRIFRFGDGWINEATLRLLEDLGVQIDLTVEPGHAGVPSLVPDERSTGSIPDRRSAPREPYRPARHDFTRRDRGHETKLWCIPVTTGHYRVWPWEGRGRRSPQAWIEATRRHPMTLNLGFDPRRFLPIFDSAVSAGRRPYAAMVVRTDVGSHAGLLACVRRNLDAMLNHRLADRFVFVTPTEALRMLTG
jgi:peptidoglycan/xylan/chitin deacetylase (PgdA/CDA1 family)